MTRPYNDRTDRAAALDKLPHAQDLITSRALELVVDDTGPAAGYATFIDRREHGPPILGEVWTAASDRALFYRLVLDVVHELIARGHTHGEFYVHDRALLAILRRDFQIHPEPEGVDTRTRQASTWRIEVELADAKAQLDRVT